MDDVRNTFEANVFAVMAMVQAFIRPLIAAKGLIVNISSLSSITPYCFGSVYCATKGAVNAYSRTLRLELRPFGVRVMVAMTGTIKSNIASRTHRELLPDSLYEPVKDVFTWRLTFSQNNATVPTREYAAKLVAAALREESAGPLGRLLGWGPPKWFWAGGFAGGVKFLTWFGEWLIDLVLARTFRLGHMTKKIQEANAGKKNV